jgi:phospholipase/carboxylesterase
MGDEPELISGPHQGQPVLVTGEPLGRARAAMVMVHGRGASAEDILRFATDLAQPGFAFLAPQAANGTWYPNSFLAPIPSNEPGLSSGLALLDAVVSELAATGLPTDSIVMLGFSQGACLVLEYVARHARRYGGVVGWSGGLIGPEGTTWVYPGVLAGTPVFLGCSERDPHVPNARVDLTAEVLRRLGGEVTERIYPHMGHEVNQDEIAFVRGMMAAVIT